MIKSINIKKVGLLEGGNRLMAGKHRYTVTNMEIVPVKSDPRGKEEQIVVHLAAGDYHCKEYLSVMSSNEVQCRIAMQTLGSLAAACGFNTDNEFKIPLHFKTIIDKNVIIDARETKGKGENKDKVYINITSITAADDDEDDEEEETEDSEEESEDESEEETEESEDGEEESEDEEEEETPPPAKTKKPAASTGKKKLPWS